ncbi:unnamed protein product [Callosobruchus maculatus]|uniref:Uncharacterized protein n=1 Tax=Callosobruchus maculatus TaxID=64391 RepID=A0A653BG26_CALMS|nr:unnamed protein product [Callosobruchus maculatus]
MSFLKDFDEELSKKRDLAMQKYQECKIRSTFAAKNAAKRYYLHKELRDLKFNLLDKQSEIDRLERNQKYIYEEIMLLKDQAKATKDLIEEVIHTMEQCECENDISEANFQREMNQFLCESREYISKIKNLTEQHEEDSEEKKKLKREERLAELRRQGQMEALALIDKYEQYKDKNLKRIQELLSSEELL